MSFSTTLLEPSFSENLASCFIDCNLTHCQGNSVLSVLKTHTCFSNLPKDVRTLLNTPRHRVVYDIEPGQYLHFNVEVAIVKNLSNALFVSLIRELELDFSTDGCLLDKSGTIQIWPIQCRISNVKDIKPIVVGIYKGAQKSNNANVFFQKFITDVKSILSNGGVNFRGNLIPVRLRSFIADAPARAFILNHRLMSQHPCSKCKVRGTLIMVIMYSMV
ncbi:uncharacterized protein LOC116853571 [Odontomachus brunneus]|uniref:uncharacterized protein LOC116853571 n=1 Tax=Odontomachus brunneus TaxID=486640 RepID=UPI0013F1CBDA|nr:uncharacterized protein LOC116853571 [Odontomachus brunneus]